MSASNTPAGKPARATRPARSTRPKPPKPRLARRLLKAVAQTVVGIVALFIGAVVVLWWWAGTDSSLATTLGWVRQSQPLSAQGVSGSLRAGGHIDELQWQKDGLTVVARDVRVAWQPLSLLHGTLQLTQLSAASIEADDQRPPEPSAAPTALGLPVPVVLEDFSVGRLDWRGKAVVSVSGIAGHYAFTGWQHRLDLRSAQVANGSYSARATLSASAPLTLEASLSGALGATLPNREAPVPLSIQATASGALTELAIKAELQMAAVPGAEKAAQPPPHASATALLTPWAAQPLAQADATFRDLDIAALWPDAPKTLLTGSATVRPAPAPAPAPGTGTAASASPAWLLNLQLANALPGPWDQQRLPLEQLETQGEWRDGMALVRSLKAQLGGGELLASGDWSTPAPASPPAAVSPVPAPAPVPVPTPAQTPVPAPAPAPIPVPVPAPVWTLKATLKQINPAKLHTKLGPLPLDGQAELSGQGAAARFSASLQAVPQGRAGNRAALSPSAKKNLLTQLNLRDASASGSWNPEQAGGTLVLSALRVRTDEAELSGQLEAQPAAKGGQGKLTLTAPGLQVSANGELRPRSGTGDLNIRGRDAAQALHWLQKLPGMPAAVLGASASGNAQLQANWKGGWMDPTLQARLDVPSLDWRPAAGKATKSTIAGARTPTGATSGASPALATSATSITPAPAAPSTSANSSSSANSGTATAVASSAPAKPSTTALASANSVKIRALQITLAGRLSQAQFTAQGRAELDQRRFNLQLAASGGRLASAGAAPVALGKSAWQGLLQQLSLGVEDPALGAGAWRLATQGSVPLKWTSTPTGGAFQSGAGQALLSAPPAKTSAAAPAQATLSWQPVRWRPGELITAGKLTGLPMAWIELIAGPQLASAGLSGNMVFDGQWDAVLSNTLKLKASLARSSGDLTVQAQGVPGNSARVSAGVKQARLTLDNSGEALSLAIVWDSERAGSAEGQLSTRLARTAGAGGASGWVWPMTAPLSGQLRAQLPRVGVWSLMAPPGWRLRGSLGADVAISGTRAAPNLSGDLQADDLALRSIVDGIEFGNGRLRARLDGTRMRISEFTLQGAGDKGTGGSLTAQGEAGWIDGKPQVQLQATLQRLRASIRTDRQVTISGEVQASLQGQQTELTGKLVIDQARIILPDEGTPRLGDDVVVRTPSGAAVGQKAPAQTSGEVADKAARPVNLALQLDLGRDFQIKGKGIDTLVRGTLALSGTSLKDPRLNGTIRTSGGQYRAYGQRLDVVQGVLRFTGAIDNPTLDILAIRPNLTQRVGVQITGTALLPSVRLYAQPELPDAEKLSWLIVGRPSASGGAEAALLQQAALALLGSKTGGMSGGLAASLGLDELSFRAASGDGEGASGGAITLGKRFSRNFYAAYERSLSGALGTLYVFYDLSRRFTIRAQAGDQSAVDLIFTIPYD